MGEARTIEKLLEDYPPNMLPKDVARFLNVSLSTVYSLIKQSDFPVMTMPGGRIHLIPKHKFLIWYSTRVEKESPESHS